MPLQTNILVCVPMRTFTPSKRVWKAEHMSIFEALFKGVSTQCGPLSIEKSPSKIRTLCLFILTNRRLVVGFFGVNDSRLVTILVASIELRDLMLASRGLNINGDSFQKWGVFQKAVPNDDFGMRKETLDECLLAGRSFSTILSQIRHYRH